MTEITLPDQVPVMPLPGAVLFPRALLPLHIFEERYREMLDHALARSRMFCVSLIKPHQTDWSSSEDFHDVASVGLIRACVGRGDGTSDLILQGLQRVRLKAFTQVTPFPIARLEPLESDLVQSVETEALAAKVLELYTGLKRTGRELPEKVDRYLADMSDPEMLADLVAATFIDEPVRRQRLLEQLGLNDRLRLLIQYLREEPGTAAA